MTKKEPLQAIAAAARDWSNLHRGDGQFVVRPDLGASTFPSS